MVSYCYVRFTGEEAKLLRNAVSCPGQCREQGFKLGSLGARARFLNDCTILPFINNPSSALNLEQPLGLPKTTFY